MVGPTISPELGLSQRLTNGAELSLERQLVELPACLVERPSASPQSPQRRPDDGYAYVFSGSVEAEDAL
jgi:hypothetical protein